MSDPGPLRLPPPERRADATLGELLGGMARSSVPTVTPLRRRRWATPFAGAILLLASGGVAWGTGAVLRHDTAPEPARHGEPLRPPATSAGPTPSAPSVPSAAPGTLADAAASSPAVPGEDRSVPARTVDGPRHHDGTDDTSEPGSGSTSGARHDDGPEGSPGPGGTSGSGGSSGGSGSSGGPGSSGGSSGSDSSSGSGSGSHDDSGSGDASSGSLQRSIGGSGGRDDGVSSPSPTLIGTSSIEPLDD